jgi:hypothetical protein
MAAPKAAGCFFGGTFRGSRNPQGVCRAVSPLSGSPIGTADEAESWPPPGAASFPLAVPESP